MSAAVVPIHTTGLLTKKQLAVELDRSERWIELRQRDGLPVADTDRYGRRKYRLADVIAWMHERDARPRSTADRLADVEARLAVLTQTVEQLQEKTR